MLRVADQSIRYTDKRTRLRVKLRRGRPAFARGFRADATSFAEAMA
jgi:hypothetical protein